MVGWNEMKTFLRQFELQVTLFLHFPLLRILQISFLQITRKKL